MGGGGVAWGGTGVLRALLDEAEMSNAGLARAVVNAAGAWRWIRGPGPWVVIQPMSMGRRGTADHLEAR